MAKKKAVLFIAELRSTYNCILQGKTFKEGTHSFNLELSNLATNILRTGKMLGADAVIYTGVTPLKSDNSNQDISCFAFKDIKGCINYMTYIEAEQIKASAQASDIEVIVDKVFYPEGYFSIDKTNGYGNYQLKQNNQAGQITKKVANYLQELADSYDILEIVYFNDGGYNEELLPPTQIPVTRFRPLQYGLSPKDSFFDFNPTGYGYASSSLPVLYGLNECFLNYNEYLAKFPNLTREIK